MPQTESNTQLQQDLKAFDPGVLGPSEWTEDTLGPDDLTEDLQEELRALCKRFSEQGRWARRIEVQTRRRNRLYWQGIQRLAYNWKDFQFQIPYSGPSTPVSGGSDAADRPPILDTTNIYQRDGRSLIAVLSQNVPNVRFEPENPRNELDIRTAATAEKLRKFIERNNNMPEKQIKLNWLQWTDGRIVSFTRYVKDAQRYGVDEEGQPRGQEQIDWFGVLEARVPITANCINEWQYCDLSVEEDVVALQARYPDSASKIDPGSANFGEDEYDRIARLSVRMAERLQVLAGDTYTHLATHKRAWLRPSTFASVTDEARRKTLFETFPHGCKVVFSGTAFCSAEDQSMDDVLAELRPLPGDGQDTPALGDLEISVQDRVNDLFDISMEAYEMGLPTTWINQKLIDVKALQDSKSEFGAFQGFDPDNLPPGDPIANHIHREDQVTVSPDMMKHMTDLFGPVAQSLTGNLPSLFGGDMQDQKTASGYKLAQDAAMGQMGIIWRAIKTFYARVMLQAVMCAAKNRNEDIMLNEGEQQTEISLADLKGKIQCYPVTDENFPESPTQQRQALTQLMTMATTSPELAKILLHPDNQAFIKATLGLEELRVPGKDSRDKALADIQELLKGGPVPGAVQMVPGPNGPVQQPGMPQSSVKVDAVFDDVATEFEEYKSWMNSAEARMVKNSNQEGWLNVKLHGMELHGVLQQQQAQQMQQAVMMQAAAHPPKQPPPHPPAQATTPVGSLPVQ